MGLSVTSFMDRFSSLKMVNRNVSILVMDLKMLERATDGFKESNILGQGAFGCVYKGMLDDDMYIAVKKLDCGSQDASKVYEVKY